MIISYFAGQRYFPVPYPVRKLMTYLAVMTVLFLVQKGVYALTADMGSAFVIRLVSGMLLMLAFVRLVWVAERKELQGFPLIGKFI